VSTSPDIEEMAVTAPGNGGFLPNSTFLGMVATGRFVPTYAVAVWAARRVQAVNPLS